MSRHPYPLEPRQEPTADATSSRGDVFPIRAARVVAGWLVEFGAWRERHIDISAALGGIALLIIGTGLAFAGFAADTYMHRGVETGTEEPYTIQPTGTGLASNIDLRVFPDGELQSVADALSVGGFRYVRQPISWEEIEVEQGVFVWDAYDLVIDEMARRDIRVIAVILDAPTWSLGNVSQDGTDAPPADPSLLGTFTEELTSRYGGAVPFVQVWDQPNRAARWGGAPATGAEFLPYLAAAYNGARSGNPEVRIITPELAYRTAESDDRADLDFLRQLYLVGADSFFDIVGIQLDGGTTSPDDRRIADDRHNFSRAILTRELMVEQEDAGTPVWATSFGWARTSETSESEQAEFVMRAQDRAWAEWPWMGLMFQWAFLAPAGSGAEPFALVFSNGSATELYRRLSGPDMQVGVQVADTGFTPMDASSVSYSGSWEDQHLEERTFRTTNQIGAEVVLTFRGTGATAILRIGPESGNLIIEVDGTVVPGGGGESGDEWNLFWTTTSDTPVQLASDLDYGEHEVTIRLAQEGRLTAGGLIVERRQPFVWPVVLLSAGAIISLFFGVRSLVMLVARRSGFLPRPEDEEGWPELPRVPDWQPSRKI